MRLEMENDGSVDDSDLPIFEEDQIPTISTVTPSPLASQIRWPHRGKSEGERRRSSEEAGSSEAGSQPESQRPGEAGRRREGVTLNLSLRNHQVSPLPFLMLRSILLAPR